MGNIKAVRMRFLASLVLVTWMLTVWATSLARLPSENARSLTDAYGAAHHWLLALPVWRVLPLGRPTKLAGACLLAALTVGAAREPAYSPKTQPVILLGLLMVTAIVQRLAGPSHWGWGNAHDR